MKDPAWLARQLMYCLKIRNVYAHWVPFLMLKLHCALNARKGVLNAARWNNAQNARISSVFKKLVVFTTVKWAFTQLKHLALNAVKAVLDAKIHSLANNVQPNTYFTNHNAINNALKEPSRPAIKAIVYLATPPAKPACTTQASVWAVKMVTATCNKSVIKWNVLTNVLWECFLQMAPVNYVIWTVSVVLEPNPTAFSVL